MIKEPELILKQMTRCCSRLMRKCSSLLTIPYTVVGQGRLHISFHVDIENEILCHEPGMSTVIKKNVKNFGIENQSPSWTFRGIQVTMYQGCCYLSSLCT